MGTWHSHHDEFDDEYDAEDYADGDEYTSEDTMPCPNCGKHVFDDAERCNHCGEYLSASQPGSQKPLWIVVTAILLVIAFLYPYLASLLNF